MCSLAVIHRSLRANLPRPYQRWFLPTPTPKRSSLTPPAPMNSLSPYLLRHGSRSPWARAEKPPLAICFIDFEALLPSPVRTSSPGFPGAKGRSPPGFLALLSFPRPRLRSSTQPAREQLSTSPESSVKTQGISRPLKPGEAPPIQEEREEPRRQLSALSRLASEPALAGPLSPSALEHQAHLEPLTLRALKYVESGVSPQRSPSPLSFFASSQTSWLNKNSGPGLWIHLRV